MLVLYVELKEELPSLIKEKQYLLRSKEFLRLFWLRQMCLQVLNQPQKEKLMFAFISRLSSKV